MPHLCELVLSQPHQLVGVLGGEGHRGASPVGRRLERRPELFLGGDELPNLHLRLTKSDGSSLEVRHAHVGLGHACLGSEGLDLGRFHTPLVQHAGID